MLKAFVYFLFTGWRRVSSFGHPAPGQVVMLKLQQPVFLGGIGSYIGMLLPDKSYYHFRFRNLNIYLRSGLNENASPKMRKPNIVLSQNHVTHWKKIKVK